MRISLWRTFVGALVSSIIFSVAWTAQADETADRTALRRLKDTYEEAINSNHLALLKPILAESFSGVMVTGEEVKSFQELEVYWQKMLTMIGEGGNYHVTVNYRPSEFFGDIAVSYGATDETVHSKGKEFRYNSLWTAVSEKKDGAWKVVRIHATMNPLNNVFVAQQRSATKLSFGIFGLIVGLPVGYFVRYTRRRKV